MQKKINLSDITTIDTISNEISSFAYEGMLKRLISLEDEEALVTILQTIKENENVIFNIIANEILFINNNLTETSFSDSKDISSNNILDDCLVLSKLSFVFEKLGVNIENIIVMNTVTEAIPEQKITLFFREELVELKNCLKENINIFLDTNSTIKKKSNQYSIAKAISEKLINLLERLEKISKDTMKKSASEILSFKSMEEQLKFFSIFFDNYVKSAIPTENLLTHAKDDEEYIDAEEIQENNNEEYTLELKEEIISTLTESLTESLNKTISETINQDGIILKLSKIDEVQDTMLELNSIESKEKEKKDINLIQKLEILETQQNRILDYLEKEKEITDNKIVDLTKKVDEISNSFSEFIKNQENFTRLIISKYNLKTEDLRQ